MSKDVFNKIKAKVAQIPKGKVATYGQIASLAGVKDARVVGWAMHGNTDNEKVPCHRVVNAEGFVAENYAFDGWKEQKIKLTEEGVTFKSEKQVDLQKHLWEMVK